MKILVYSDGPSVITGFGTVIRNIFLPLIESGKLQTQDVSFFAINYDGAPIDLPFRQWPAVIGMSADRDPYGRMRFIDMLAKGSFGSFDILFCLLDHFSMATPVNINGQMMPFLAAAVQIARQPDRPPFRVVDYVPVDSEQIHPEWVTFLPTVCDSVVSYTQFGARILLDTCPALKDKLSTIPHGTNPELFFPIPDTQREEFRQQVFKLKPGQPLIVNVNRNQPRKDLPRALQIFARVRAQMPEAKLYLHCNVVDSMGFNLDQVRAALRLPSDAVIFPQGFNEGVGVPIQALNLIYNAGDVALTTARGEGWGLCLDPKTPVYSDHGTVPMAAVDVGYHVIGIDGCWHRVQARSRRYEATLSLKALGTPSLKVTADHPIFAKSDVSAPPAWVRAGSLRPKHYVAVVRPNWRQPLPARIDLAEWVSGDGMTHDAEAIWCHMGYSGLNRRCSLSAIQRQFGVSKRVAEDARRFVMGYVRRGAHTRKVGTSAWKTAEALRHDPDFVVNQPIRVNRFIPIDDTLLNLIGWYLAEGNVTQGRIDLSLCDDERDVAEGLGKYVSDTFGVAAFVRSLPGHRIRLEIGSKILGQFLLKMSGAHKQEATEDGHSHGCLFHTIHPVLEQSATSLGPLIAGLFQGDGHRGAKCWTLSTISEHLAWQVRQICATNGVFAAVRSDKPRGCGRHPFWTVIISGDAVRRFCEWTKLPLPQPLNKTSRTVKVNVLVEPDALFVRVHSVEKNPLVEEVMDLQVEDAHSFVAGGLLVHNSATEAMCAGTPVVAPDHTSFSEILAEGRGILVPPEVNRQVMISDNDQLRPVADVTAMAEQVLWVLQHRHDARAMGQRGREWATQLAWKQAVVPQWWALFQRLTERPKLSVVPRHRAFNAAMLASGVA